jgi:hypothetical protein
MSGPGKSPVAGRDAAEDGLAVCEELRETLRELSFAGDSDAASLAEPAAAKAWALGEQARAKGQAKMGELCGLLGKVLARIAGNAALAKPSILGTLADALDKLEAMAADPDRAARVDAARILFQLELACGPSRARH